MLTIEEAATRLRVTPETVRRQLRAGRLEGTKFGSKWLISPQTLEQVLSPARNTTGDEAEALWREMTSDKPGCHNAAILALAKASSEVRAIIQGRSAQAAAAFYATPEGEAELADWRALDGEPFHDDEGDGDDL